MPLVELVPCKPEEKHFGFLHGVIFDFNSLGIFVDWRHPDREGWNSLPMLMALGNNDSAYNFVFSRKKNKYAVFDLVKPPESPFYSKGSFDERNTRSISIEQWRESIALYHDFLAAEAEEAAAQQGGKTQTHHLILDQQTVQGERKQRRLIGSYFTRLGAAYALRQHSAWVQCKWERRSLRDALLESAQSREFDVTEESITPSEVRVQMTTSYPFSRGRRAPFTMVWRWHLSRQVPLVEAGSVPLDDVGDDRDERWTHRPGDPRILRETGTGLFGSYPSFEGDDESEYQDER